MMQRDRWVSGVAFLMISLSMLVAPALAGTMSVTWDPVESATGYRAYYGTSTGQYSYSINVGNTTYATLQGLNDCTTYYVAVKAYNTGGESVDFSDELTGWSRPEINSSSPGSVQQGEQFTMTIHGANFLDDAVLSNISASIPEDEQGNPLFHIESTNVVSCSRMEALVTVETQTRGFRAMEVGQLPLAFEILNPGGVYGSGNTTLDIQFNSIRADINQSNSQTEDRVDGGDLAWLAYAMASNEGSVRYNPDADLNGDGMVDGEDLALMAPNFGRCWSSAGWTEDTCQ
jgi:hypothetical protein